MSFESPLLLLSLLAVPLAIALYALVERRRMRYAVRFTNLDVLAGVVGGRAWRRYVPLGIFLLALAAACAATARPHANRLVAQENATVILVIDVSRSMSARDVKPTRLLAAEAALRTFLDRVPGRLRVGLIAFAGAPSTVAPPTRDHDLVRESLAAVGDYGSYGGTAIGDALAAAVELGQEAVRGSVGIQAAVRPAARSARGLVSILFLSDGAQRNGYLQPLQGAARAKAAGIPVYTVALGTPNGYIEGGFGPGGRFGGRRPVPPDPDTLRAIAATTGGKFFDARSSEAVESAYASLGSSLGRTRERTEVTHVVLAGAAGLLVLEGLLSALWSPRLP